MPPADPAALAEAVATVRGYSGDPLDLCPADYDERAAACELLARYVAEHAGELVRVRGLEWKSGNTASLAVHALSYTDSFFGRISVVAPARFPYVEAIGAFKCREYYGGDYKPEYFAAMQAMADDWNRSRLAAALEPLLPEVRE